MGITSDLLYTVVCSVKSAAMLKIEDRLSPRERTPRNFSTPPRNGMPSNTGGVRAGSELAATRSSARPVTQIIMASGASAQAGHACTAATAASMAAPPPPRRPGAAVTPPPASRLGRRASRRRPPAASKARAGSARARQWRRRAGAAAERRRAARCGANGLYNNLGIQLRRRVVFHQRDNVPPSHHQREPALCGRPCHGGGR